MKSGFAWEAWLLIYVARVVQKSWLNSFTKEVVNYV